jgi:hypothetical protein
VEVRSQAVALALALSKPSELDKPLDAGAGSATPFATPPALQNVGNDADTRHDVGTLTFDTEKWW